MRFAWLRTEQEIADTQASGGADRFLHVAYNVIWWVPVALPLIGATSYFAGLVAFLTVTFVRAAVNVYRVNIMPVDRADRFPLRSP